MIPYNPRFTMRLFEVRKYIPVYPAVKLHPQTDENQKKINASKKKPTDSWNIPKISQKSPKMKDSLHKQVVFPGSGVCSTCSLEFSFNACMLACTALAVPMLGDLWVVSSPSDEKMPSKLTLGVERKPWKSKNRYPKTVFVNQVDCVNFQVEEFQSIVSIAFPKCRLKPIIKGPVGSEKERHNAIDIMPFFQ